MPAEYQMNELLIGFARHVGHSFERTAGGDLERLREVGAGGAVNPDERAIDVPEHQPFHGVDYAKEIGAMSNMIFARSVAAIALSWAALAGPTPDPATAAAIAVWYLEGGQKHVTTLGEDFKTISDAAELTDLKGVQTGCLDLKTDVENAQGYRPLPDRQAQEHWSKALAHFENGAIYCVLATDGSLNNDLLNRSSSEVVQGNTDMTALNERLKEIGG
jgi:hypothetical protein